VAETPNLPKAWTGTAITDALKDRDIEFHLENDANLAALGEHHFGPGRDVRNLVLLTLGTGIGGGIIVDDGILRGATGAAAEVGHLTLEPGGRLCGCGHTGCFEQYGSARGLEQTYESLAGEHRSAREIAKRANGDPLAREAMTQTGLYLGRGLAQIINLLEPGLVLFSGGLAGSLEHLRPHIRAGLDTHVFASRARSIPLKRADRDQPALMGTHALIASRGVKSA
jgi:glucokinase